MALDVFRKLMVPSQMSQVSRIVVTVEEEVASYLNNKKRREIAALEQTNGMEVQVVSGEGFSPEFLKIECFDANGREVKFGAG
jgi:ribonuclease E